MGGSLTLTKKAVGSSARSSSLSVGGGGFEGPCSSKMCPELYWVQRIGLKHRMVGAKAGRVL